ncbi:hypothetical protein [Leifsonia sp. 1010]|uniref:hypothetical protein n=1 Tax=Leifsonia sp. 1010 TaxID=2817769 RepID=UPI00285AC388|nr:hypothetical protein [Leifsonia sp. 1010]MDR6611606.1 signal transduction histidine kinase [Leifsonia sp. 1010]
MLLTNFRRSFARVYGPSAITVWSWLITLPFAVTVMSGLQYVDGGPVEVLAVSGLAHAILGGVLLAGAALLHLVRGRARPVVVFALFAVAGGLRPILFLEAGGLLSIPVAPGDLVGRISINVVALVVAFSLIAIGVDLVREHRGVFRRLRAAQRASQLDVECASERLRQLRADTVDDVAAALEEAAAAAASRPMEPSAAARVLRTLAEDVVRPASHRVYAAAAPDELAEGAGAGAREWSASVLGGMRAAPPTASAALFSALVVPFGVLLFGAVSALPVAVGFAVLLAANSAVSRLRLPRRPLPRLTLLLGSYGLVGVLLALSGATTLRLAGVRPESVWFEALTYPLIAMAVAFVGSLAVRTRLDQEELESALQANVATAARIRSEYERERGSLARLLHAGVQSELIAGALSLTASAGPNDAGARMAEIVGRARDALRGAQDEPDAAEQVRMLLDSWSSAIRLTATIGDGVWERLEDGSRTAAVVDAVSEGLANAVRHGDGSPVALELRPAAHSGVEVVVRSGGALAASEAGIGLKQLSERGTVALRELSGRVELAVAIP